jgi:hypothetical protein
LTESARSTRVYRTFGEIRRMIARTAFTQLRFSWWRVGATVVAMGIVFVAPPLIVLFAHDPLARALGALGWACMTFSFVPMLRFYRVPALHALALPAIGAIYLALTLDSAVKHLRGRGGEWKGRVTPRTALSQSGRT